MDELKLVLGVKKNLVGEAVWKQMMKDVDTDGDGEISFEEFSTMMIRLVKDELRKSITITKQ